ncbi:MAG: hypothetical protein ABI488_26520 [Polyangiaceae bacterium]
MLQDALCACETGYGLTGNECLACGDNEVGSLDGCDCAPGFGRTDATQPCTRSEAGKPCSADGDCKDALFSYCASAKQDGYCTRPDCASSADCTNDYSCNARDAHSFCQRPPSGFGTTCHSSTDCAAFEASYCEVLSSHACLLSGCKADPSICPGDWACCNIPLLGNSLCLPQDQLSAGACPAGGTLVPGGN